MTGPAARSSRLGRSNSGRYGTSSPVGRTPTSLHRRHDEMISCRNGPSAASGPSSMRSRASRLCTAGPLTVGNRW